MTACESVVATFLASAVRLGVLSRSELMSSAEKYLCERKRRVG